MLLAPRIDQKIVRLLQSFRQGEPRPRATEALALVGQTANSVCGCGGDMMAATLTINEATYYAVNRQMRGDTKIKWRKGLVECVHPNTQ